MTTIDWKLLRPHMPLAPGADDYVARFGSASEEISNWILADRSPLLIGGPAGIGKSTELARAAELLQPHRVACFVPLDRFENMRRLTVERMLLRVVQRVGYLARKALQLRLSSNLESALDSVSAVLSGEPNARIQEEPRTLAMAMLSEIRRVSKQGRVTLLIDGLEKVPQGPESLELFDGLASVQEDVQQVVVIPWHAAFGPQAETAIRAGERFIPVRAVEIEGEAGAPGCFFLRQVLLRRLHMNDEALDPDAVVGALGPSLDEARARVSANATLVCDAIRWSGGVPRVFLQLMADAGSYAKLRRSDPWPNVEDLNEHAPTRSTASAAVLAGRRQRNPRRCRHHGQ